MASNFLVTLYRSASLLVERAGPPPEALIPLMRRTIENGFDLTGPIARGDWSTVHSHEAACRCELSCLEPLYRALAQVARTGRDAHVAEIRQALEPLRGGSQSL